MAATLLIHSREEWGAELPDYRNYAPFDQPAHTRFGWVLHYPGAKQYIHDHSDCPHAVRAIQHYHKYVRLWSDGAYSFVLCPHGAVYDLRGWDWNQFATSPETNNDHPHYTVCVLVDPEEDPTDVQFEVLRLLIQEGRTRGCGLAVKPHSSLQSTACPGAALRSFAALVDGREFKPESPALEEDEELNGYVVYKDARYQNLWLVGGGGAVHLSPALASHYIVTLKVPTIVDQHEQTLTSLLALSGNTRADLVA